MANMMKLIGQTKHNKEGKGGRALFIKESRVHCLTSYQAIPSPSKGKIK